LSSYPSNTREFLLRFWWVILLIYAGIFGVLLINWFSRPPEPPPWPTETPSLTPSDTATPTDFIAPTARGPRATVTLAATAQPVDAPSPTQSPRPTATRRPTATPKPTKIPPTPTVCPAICPAGMTTTKCDATSAYCQATLAQSHCEQADDCNAWCTQSYGFDPNRMTWSCSKPSTEPHTVGVCVCRVKLP
jgi:hypothetical protein